MDGEIVLLVLTAILFLAGMPIAALVLAITANNRVRQNATRLQAMEKKLTEISQRIAQINVSAVNVPIPDTTSVQHHVEIPAAATMVTKAAPSDESGAVAKDMQADSYGAAAYRVSDDGAQKEIEARPVAHVMKHIGDTAASSVSPDTDSRSDSDVILPTPSPEPSPEPSADASPESQPQTSDVPAPTTDATADDTPATPPRSLEEQIGLVWFTRIGALIGILVAGWFFKYVVDNDIVGPWGRVAIGAIIGLGALIAGELLFKSGKTNRIFNQSMQGLGLALMLISTYASSGFYHLVSVPTAFGITAVLCLLGGALAIRHRSEGVLIFSLIAALMNPVMLSTGTDRPLALFAYLGVITILTLFFCVKHNFRITIWIAVSGVILLFLGWYGKYFDIQPEVIANDIKREAGAYTRLTARIIPLSAAILFPVFWAIAGTRMNTRGHRQSSLALLLGAGVAITGGLTALLHDHGIILAGSLLGISAAYSALIIRMRFGQYLGVPMLTSFFTLLWLSKKTDESDMIWMLLLGGALAVLFMGMVIREMIAKRTRISMPSLFVLCGSGVLFIMLASIMLLPDWYVPFGIIIVATSLLYLFFASFMGNQVLLTAAAIVSAVLLISQSDSALAVDDGYILVACAWFIVYVLAAAYELLVKKTEWTRSLFALLTGTGAAFLSLVLANTQPEHNTLRSLLCIGAGIIYLVIGTRLLRQKSTHNDLTLLPLGTALGFFGIATGLLLSGVSMTVAFALEAIFLAYLASKSKRNDSAGNIYWFIAALVFGGVALVHMFGADIGWLSHQRQLFFQTQGSEGVMYATPLLNPFALSRIAIAAFLFLTAFFFRKTDGYAAAVKTGVILGHVLIIWLLTTEIQLLLAKAVVFKPGLTPDEFNVVWGKMNALLSNESTQRGMIITSVMGIYALGLIGAGFALRDVMHRILGIALFGLTLLKLGLWDIWNFDTIYRIAVGATMAVTLMTGGYLYARFRNRLKSIVSNQGPDRLIMLAIIVVGGSFSLAAPAVHATDLAQYAYRCELKGSIEKGDYALEITPSLYELSQHSGALSDIRIIGPDNQEAPFTVRRETTVQRHNETHRSGAILNPVELADGATSVTVDFGESVFSHNSIALDLSGQNYMRHATIESSTSGVDYGLLSRGQLVYAVFENGKRYANSRLQYPATNARYLRITISPGEDDQSVRVRGVKAIIHDATSEEIPLFRTLPLSLSKPQKDSDGRTVVMLGKIAPNVPLSSISFKVANKVANDEFVRRVVIQASTHKESWFNIGGGVIYQINDAMGDDTRTAFLDIKIEPTSHSFLRAVFYDQDNAPLTLQSAQASYPMEKVVFRTKKSGPHALYIGDAKTDAPQYDLNAILQRSDRIDFKPLSLGECRRNALSVSKDAKQQQPWTEQYATLLKILMGIVLLGLIVWTVKTLKLAGKS